MVRSAACGLGVSVAVAMVVSARAPRAAAMRLFQWEQGLGLEAAARPGMKMYLRFYEWNLFDALESGQQTRASFARFKRNVSPDGGTAELTSDDMRLVAEAAPDGAKLRLTVTNRSDHDWPDAAGIIPCFTPGVQSLANPAFANKNSFFLGGDGLLQLHEREIHFARELRETINAVAGERGLAFSEKWPTSPVDAAAGFLARESNDRRWVAGVAWERFVSVQGHNFWDCLHVCARVGPLKRGESRTIRGRLYLFRGDRNDCLRRYRAEFPDVVRAESSQAQRRSGF
jgi:hypothetical protein